MRGRLSRRELEIARAAVKRLQAVVRMRLARKEFLQAKSSALLIQAGFRGALVRGGIAAQVRPANLTVVSASTFSMGCC